MKIKRFFFALKQKSGFFRYVRFVRFFYFAHINIFYLYLYTESALISPYEKKQKHLILFHFCLMPKMEATI